MFACWAKFCTSFVWMPLFFINIANETAANHLVRRAITYCFCSLVFGIHLTVMFIILTHMPRIPRLMGSNVVAWYKAHLSSRFSFVPEYLDDVPLNWPFETAPVRIITRKKQGKIAGLNYRNAIVPQNSSTL